jgi:hypothetical protein
MKHLKILGLLAIAAAALMAFAASASATTITSPTGTPYTGEIEATSEGTVLLHNPIANIECHSTVHGKELTHGSGSTAIGEITTLDWGTEASTTSGICHDNWHVTNVTTGNLEIHYKEAGVGTLTSTGATVTTTRFGVTCNYRTNATHIGTFTDSHKTGKTATLHVEANIPIHSGSSFFCGSAPAGWTGSYEVKVPDKIYIDP